MGVTVAYIVVPSVIVGVSLLLMGISNLIEYIAKKGIKRRRSKGYE